VPVELEGDPARPSFIWMSQQDATFDPALENREAVARALGLTGADLWPAAPIQPGSTGNKFLFVPLRDKATVDRAVLDVRAVLEAMGERPRMGIFVFAPDPDASAGRVYSRMFGPHSSGIPEDPATGSASGPLGAYLVLNGMVKGSGDVRIVSEQGAKMGRQSFVHIRLATRGGAVTDIRVGGGVVPVLEGELRLS
jgi:trans-2,3-dihydro-3-hydroxyanthranilate isomerase